MRYKPTPLNIVAAGLILASIWYGIYPGAMGFGLVVLFYLLPLGLFILFIDLIIQRSFVSNLKHIFVIETFLLLMIAFGYFWTQKTKTYILPDKLSSNYIVTIYDVDNAPKLPINLLTWNYEVKIPDNGILLTSTSFDDELRKTKMKTYSGIELNSDISELGFIGLLENEFDCNGKKYNYRSWIVDNVPCCIYSINDLDTLKMKIENYYCE